MRNTVLKVFFSLLLVLFVVSCKQPDPTIPVAGVSLSKTSLEMTVGDKEELTATVTPAEATNKKVTWTTSDANVAEIIEMRGGGGLQVIGRAPGTATITVKTEDGGKTAKCRVTVNDAFVDVAGVTIDPPSKNMLAVGESITLTATVSPDNATNKSVTWSSDDEAVAKVGATTGKVTAEGVGEATITVTTANGGKTASYKITVHVPVESITLDKESATLFIGNTLTLTATVTPDTATDKSITWTSSNGTVATVDQNGKVTAKSVGTATITAKAGEQSANCTITVKQKVAATGVEILHAPETLDYGTPLKLEAKVIPDTATNQKVTWSSNKDSIATIDKNGNVKTVGDGDVTFTVKTEDGGHEDSCTIKIVKTGEEVAVS